MLYEDEDDFFMGSPKSKFFDIIFNANKNLVKEKLLDIVDRYNAMELLLEQSLEKEIEALEEREQLHWDKLDTLRLGRNTIIEKQKTLIRVEHDTITIIDTIAFSKLQEFFSNRYNQKDSIK